MAVFRATYCTRQDVMSAPDIRFTADMVRHVDSGIDAAVDDVEGLCHRRFWNAVETNAYDWPNFQRAYPWRIWTDEKEIADKDGSGPLAYPPVILTGVQSPSPQQIPLSALFWQPRNYGPPWNAIEINRATSYSYGLSNTPQEDVSVSAVVGYWSRTRPAGTVPSSLDSSSSSVIVSDSAAIGVGDVLIAGTEQMLVSDMFFVDTSVQASSGGTTASSADDVLAVPDGTAFAPGEVLMIDAEQMLITNITGDALTVERAFGGTVLAVHESPELYAQRQLSVIRGFGGTEAASYDSGTALLASLVPGQVRELAIAESLNYVFQKTSGYARTLGEAGSSPVPGGSLPDLRDRVYTAYGRQGRQRVV
jgi:hypothetical protein